MGATETVVAKSVAVVVLFIASILLGSLPILLSKLFKWDSNAKNNVYIQLLLCLGGGVLLCTTFLHLLPEVADRVHQVEYFRKAGIHLAELLMCVGFFAMYLVEESVHIYLHRREKLDTPLKRTLSVRRGLPEDSSFETPRSSLSGSVTICVDEKKEVYQQHNHSHIVSTGNNQDNTAENIRGMLVVLALSIHELFEGLAIGLERSGRNVWYMFAAVSAHKFVIAFCIGVELVTSQISRCALLVYIFMYSVVTPIGVGLGIILIDDDGSSIDMPSILLQGLASGTLLYVVFFEILTSSRKSGLKQFLAVLTGFLVMFGITFVE